MEKTKDIVNKIVELGLGPKTEKEFIDFIMNAESDLYSGHNSAGEDITVGVQQGVGVRLSTYQNNGWIRVTDYEIVEDSEGNKCVQESESYMK